MSEPQSNGSEGDGGEEVPCELVVAGGDAPEVFDFVEEALDEIALSVKREIDRALDLDVALGRNVGLGAARLDERDDAFRIIAAIGDNVAGQANAAEQGRRGGLIGGLARREQQADRQALGIDHGMDLGAQSSTRTTDGVIRAPLFPPAACWCARTMEESIR